MPRRRRHSRCYSRLHLAYSSRARPNHVATVRLDFPACKVIRGEIAWDHLPGRLARTHCRRNLEGEVDLSWKFSSMTRVQLVRARACLSISALSVQSINWESKQRNCVSEDVRRRFVSTTRCEIRRKMIRNELCVSFQYSCV